MCFLPKYHLKVALISRSEFATDTPAYPELEIKF